MPPARRKRHMVTRSRKKTSPEVDAESQNETQSEASEPSTPPVAPAPEPQTDLIRDVGEHALVQCARHQWTLNGPFAVILFRQWAKTCGVGELLNRFDRNDSNLSSRLLRDVNCDKLTAEMERVRDLAQTEWDRNPWSSYLLHIQVMGSMWSEENKGYLLLCDIYPADESTDVKCRTFCHDFTKPEPDSYIDIIYPSDQLRDCLWRWTENPQPTKGQWYAQKALERPLKLVTDEATYHSIPNASIVGRNAAYLMPKIPVRDVLGQGQSIN